MRFRCPSSSLSSDSSFDSLDHSFSDVGKRLSRLTSYENGKDFKTAGPSNAKKPSKKEDGTKRKRSTVSSAKKYEIEMAKKAVARRKHIKKREWFVVFIGNIKPTVNESILNRLFCHCGTIVRIQIRCSRGAAVTIGRPIPEHIHNPARDFQHATIEFLNANAVSSALELNGFKLHGVQLSVVLSAADLPEVKQVVRRHLDGRRAEAPTGNRRLMVHQTELSFDLPPRRDRHLCMGFSFQKSVL